MKTGMKKLNTKELFLDLFFFAAGGFIYAAAITVFTAPNNIAPGGLTGVATILNRLLAFPIGTTVLVLNIPLFLLAARILGTRFLAKTVIATVSASLFLDITPLFLPAYTANSMLAALYGGLFSGFGLALVFLRGGTTGGTDIAARLINHRSPHVSIGRSFLILDAVVIASSAVAFRSVESALYAVITIFVSSKVIDQMIYGGDKGKLLYIISDCGEKLASAIIKEVKRGVTILNSTGAYTGNKNSVIMCAVRINEVARVRKVVKTIDPKCFLIIGDASEIIGDGFKDINK